MVLHNDIENIIDVTFEQRLYTKGNGSKKNTSTKNQEESGVLQRQCYCTFNNNIHREIPDYRCNQLLVVFGLSSTSFRTRLYQNMLSNFR